jgi:hypothetical protein
MELAHCVFRYAEAQKGGFMLKLRLVVASLGLAMISSAVMQAQIPATPLPSQILTAKKVFIANAGGLLDLKMVSGDSKRDYNQFYASIQTWGHYQLVGSPAEADLVLQISIVYIPRQIGSDITPFPSFRLALLDPKTSIALWVMDEFLVDKPGLSMIREKNRDKAFDDVIAKLVGNLKALTAAPASSAK